MRFSIFWSSSSDVLFSAGMRAFLRFTGSRWGWVARRGNSSQLGRSQTSCQVNRFKIFSSHVHFSGRSKTCRLGSVLVLCYHRTHWAHTLSRSSLQTSRNCSLGKFSVYGVSQFLNWILQCDLRALLYTKAPMFLSQAGLAVLVLVTPLNLWASKWANIRFVFWFQLHFIFQTRGDIVREAVESQRSKDQIDEWDSRWNQGWMLEDNYPLSFI